MQQRKISQEMDLDAMLPTCHHVVVETSKIEKIKDELGRSKINQYTITGKLGEGSFGKVKLAIKDGTDEKFAVKSFRKSALKRKREAYRDADGKMKYKNALEDVMREIALMKKVDHQNVINLLEVIEHPESDKLYMVIEYCEAGQILDYDEETSIFTPKRKQEKYSEQKLRDYFRQMIAGLDYLHHNNIAHRDIKPQNILETQDGVVKLADLGVSVLVGDDDTVTNTQGTYHFMAPEICSNDGSGYHAKAADIWSLGITFYSFIYLKIPYQADDLSALFEMIKDHPLVFPEEPAISPKLMNLMKIMLEKDPSKRASVEDLTRDQWINDGCQSLAEISHPAPITVTQAEIRGAFHVLETVRLTKKFIKKLRSRVSQHSNSTENSEAALKKLNTNNSIRSDGNLGLIVDSPDSIKKSILTESSTELLDIPATNSQSDILKPMSKLTSGEEEVKVCV
jgi:[calcium/calmodulin-dependent protein kinase] kinase